MYKYGFLLFGTLFGFILSRAGATTQNNYAELFLFSNLQLLWVILSAVATALVGLYLFKHLNVTRFASDESLDYSTKPYRKSLVSGALLFGMGWGIVGACPGTAPVMIGEGKLMAVFVVLGIALGTLLYGFAASTSNKRKQLLLNQVAFEEG